MRSIPAEPPSGPSRIAAVQIADCSLQIAESLALYLCLCSLQSMCTSAHLQAAIWFAVGGGAQESREWTRTPAHGLACGRWPPPRRAPAPGRRIRHPLGSRRAAGAARDARRDRAAVHLAGQALDPAVRHEAGPAAAAGSAEAGERPARVAVAL